MSLPIITRDEAEADIAEAANWYKRQSSGLGGEFVRSIDNCFALIAGQPEIFPVAYRQARLGIPRRFPYQVIYRAFPDFISIGCDSWKRPSKTMKIKNPGLGSKKITASRLS